MTAMMEKVMLLFKEQEHRLGELVVDAFLSESHKMSAKASEHPVENGCCIVDHIQNLPVTLEIKGIISNTPMALVGLTAIKSARNFFNDQSNDLVTMAFKKLEDIFARREPITIATALKDYPNMVLEELRIERDSRTSASLHFSCTAKQIRIVDAMHIKVPAPKSSRTQPKKKKGLQETKTLAPEKANAIEKDNSFMFGGLQKLQGGLKGIFGG